MSDKMDMVTRPCECGCTEAAAEQREVEGMLYRLWKEEFVTAHFSIHDERVRDIAGLPRFLNTEADVRAAYKAAFGGGE